MPFRKEKNESSSPGTDREETEEKSISESPEENTAFRKMPEPENLQPSVKEMPEDASEAIPKKDAFSGVSPEEEREIFEDPRRGTPTGLSVFLWEWFCSFFWALREF